MTRQEIALEKFDEGYDCSKAVYAAFSPSIHLDQAHRKLIDNRDSWSLGMPQKWCGAVTGGCNVLELVLQERGEGTKTGSLCESLKTEFAKRNRSLVCTELLGFDLSNPQDVIKVVETGSCDHLCRKFIADAVELVESMLYDAPSNSSTRSGYRPSQYPSP